MCTPTGQHEDRAGGAGDTIRLVVAPLAVSVLLAVAVLAVSMIKGETAEEYMSDLLRVWWFVPVYFATVARGRGRGSCWRVSRLFRRHPGREPGLISRDRYTR